MADSFLALYFPVGLLYVCVMLNVLPRKNAVGLEHNKKMMSLEAISILMQTLLTFSILSLILSQKTITSSVCMKCRMCFSFMLTLIFQVLSVERWLNSAMHSVTSLLCPPSLLPSVHSTTAV